jgi:metal-responsive CopG/Arc/MetJ family transcriptional regulator
MNGKQTYQLQLPTELIERLDQWRLKQGLPFVSRAEAVRQLLTRALDAAETETSEDH